MKKYYKGEKYIYLLMAVNLCKQAGFTEKGDFSNYVKVGDDNGMVGGQNYYRSFKLQKHDEKWLLTETKTGRNFADYYKTYEIGFDLEDIKKDKPMICNYIDEYEDDCGANWQH